MTALAWPLVALLTAVAASWLANRWLSFRYDVADALKAQVDEACTNAHIATKAVDELESRISIVEAKFPEDGRLARR